MAQHTFQIEVPEDLSHFELPGGVNDRLRSLLDRQDRGERLTAPERREAEGLVDLSEAASSPRPQPSGATLAAWPAKAPGMSSDRFAGLADP